MIVGSTRTDFVYDTGIVDMGFHWDEPLASADKLFTEEEMVVERTLVPTEVSLGISNYPNPFNPNTTIYLTLNHPGELRLTVSDINGRIVATLHNGYLGCGDYQFNFSGQNLASGVYFYQAQIDGHTATGKALLVK
jgi:hypothetical protein